MLEGKQCRHYKCECGNEMIQIERSKDLEDIRNGKEIYSDNVYFAIYLHGITNHAYSLKERLRHIWQIWKYKKPYSDFAILSLEEARRMGNDLLKITDDLNDKQLKNVR